MSEKFQCQKVKSIGDDCVTEEVFATFQQYQALTMYNSIVEITRYAIFEVEYIMFLYILTY